MAMYDSFYPHYGVAKLREQHGCRWGDLIEQVRALNVTDPRVMAFTLTVKKIRKQHRLSTSLCKDPFCAVCTAEVLEHYRGSEDELIHYYYGSLREVQQTMKLMYTHRTD